MILDPKDPALDDQIPLDAPPSYDTVASSSQSLPRPSSEKSSNHFGPPTPLSPTSQSAVPRPSSSSLGSKRPSSSKSKASYSWFGFGVSKTSREVSSTVLGLIRDLVKQHTTASDTAGILDSCADACVAYDVSFSSLLQEKSIEGHTPIYWAIIKRPAEPASPDNFDLLTALLSRAAPLTPTTMSEIRLACLLTSDHKLFQRLRLSPAFAPLSGTDEMLLGASIPPDTIDVEDTDSEGGAFVARFVILSFQKRMRISKKIELEFIARGRMWELSFFVGDSSKWFVSLSILEHSPPTWIDSCLIIDDPSVPNPSSSMREALFGGVVTDLMPTSSERYQRREKAKPPITMRLKSNHEMAPSRFQNDVELALDENTTASSLQYDGCTYLDHAGNLRGRLEARLAKPEADCVIC